MNDSEQEVSNIGWAHFHVIHFAVYHHIFDWIVYESTPIGRF